jgi:hypothetical protein
MKSNKQKYREKRRAYFNRLLLRIKRWCGCLDCGERDPVVLQFDHARGVKKFTIGAFAQASRKTLKLELAKLDVRCANCHVRVSVQRDQYNWRKQ